VTGSSERGDEPAERNAVEAALAARAQARDEAAWSEIYTRHQRAVYTFLRYRLQDAEEANDVTAQVFETAFRSAERFDYRGAPIEAWLIGIARNLARDHVKRSVRRGPSVSLDVEEHAARGPDEVGAADLKADLGQAMLRLTEDQQVVVTLRFIQDRSVTETARIMNRSEDAVKNLQRRALAALRRELTPTAYSQEVRR
jgi:RNA polymerase sigma-70 factor (ECF subfamily)